MHVGIKGTAPGVGWGKKLSLSVEEWSSPTSHKAWVDADTLCPVTYMHDNIGTNGLYIAMHVHIHDNINCLLLTQL